MAGDFDATLAVFKDGVNNLPTSALGLLHRGALAACDSKDGVVDGVLDDPRQCAFDPASLSCKAGQSADTCLSAAAGRRRAGVYTAASRIRRPARNSIRVSRRAASSSGRTAILRIRFPIPIAHYKWLVFADPNWDWKSFDFSDPADYQAHQKAEAKFAPILNATDPNLKAFRQRGGKLLQYHGWNDQLITPLNSINYYESVLSFFGGGQEREKTLQDVQTFYRLFMAPGMAHCGGGAGPNTFDMQAALEQWVERGVAPERIVATRGVNGVIDRLRPLCPYPQVAVYKGQGDTNDAASFECRVPPPPRVR